MAFGVLCTMCVILIIVLAVCQWSPSAADSALKQSQHVFESDEAVATASSNSGAIKSRATTAPRHRPYTTPLVNKRVAAQQKWRCASCRSVLDETYEIDHIKPLFKGGTNSEDNLLAVCKKCHSMTSAIEQSWA